MNLKATTAAAAAPRTPTADRLLTSVCQR